MSLNAEDLYRIVRDVDRDAWPDNVEYDRESRMWTSKYESSWPNFVDEVVIASAFTGSMFEYVKEGGWHWQHWTMDKHKERTVSLEVPGHKFTMPMDACPSGLWTVALLALACKQIAS